MAKDFLGKQLKIGDEVVYMVLNYRELARGTVKSISKNMLVIANNGKDVRQFHNQVVKV